MTRTMSLEVRAFFALSGLVVTCHYIYFYYFSALHG